ncbi:hypothetical protein U9M48_010052, partial [Paspalum notatum var. saurae]
AVLRVRAVAAALPRSATMEGGSTHGKVTINAERRTEGETGNEAVGTAPGKRQWVALSARKRKPDADPESYGSGVESESESGGDRMQLVERRLSATPVTLAPLQQLQIACRALFNGSGTPPTATVVSIISRIMDRIGPHDVGLMQEVRFFNKMNTAGRQNPPIITCKKLYECNNFTIAVFFLPWGTVMPLHDHPGMTVFSKLLIGSAHVEAYDWVRPGAFTSRGDSRMLAEKVLDRDATPASGTWVLFPNSGGNMHRFVAGENDHCAFLDVLTPPYAATGRRRCAYYQDFSYEPCPCVVRALRDEGKEVEKRRLAWLQKVGVPRGLRIANLPYRSSEGDVGLDLVHAIVCSKESSIV